MPARISLFARDLPADWPIHALNLSVLYTRESPGEWCARALEMDLEAYGRDEDEALRALVAMVIAQVSFAIQRRAPELVLKDAPAVYWQLYESNRRQTMTRLISGQPAAADVDVKVGTLPIPAEILAHYQRKKPFHRQRAA